MSDSDTLDDAASRCLAYLNHIDYLACRHKCACGRKTRFVHPISDNTRNRLARDMARAALNPPEQA